VTASSRPSTPLLLTTIVALGLGAVGAALATQHLFGMQPCPWCVLQRLIFVTIAAVALLGLAWRAPAGQAVAAGLVIGLSLCGMAAALWQHFVASVSASCNQTLADRIVSGIGVDGWLPEIFQARASCAEAAAKLFGVPYEFFSLGIFMLLGALAWRGLVRARR
jgi:protein dithiol:quinone oxidoreductase